MRYKILKDYTIQDYEDNKIIFDPDTSEITILNASAWLIFSNINEKSVEDIVELFVQYYPCETYEDLKNDILKTVDQLRELGIIFDEE